MSDLRKIEEKILNIDTYSEKISVTFKKVLEFLPLIQEEKVLLTQLKHTIFERFIQILDYLDLDYSITNQLLSNKQKKRKVKVTSKLNQFLNSTLEEIPSDILHKENKENENGGHNDDHDETRLIFHFGTLVNLTNQDLNSF